MLSTPRTDPGVHDSRTGLPPWVFGARHRWLCQPRRRAIPGIMCEAQSSHPTRKRSRTPASSKTLVTFKPSAADLVQREIFPESVLCRFLCIQCSSRDPGNNQRRRVARHKLEGFNWDRLQRFIAGYQPPTKPVPARNGTYAPSSKRLATKSSGSGRKPPPGQNRSAPNARRSWRWRRPARHDSSYNPGDEQPILT